jgi:multisubunit Na+/H+ antiporter MnhB subunit
MDMEHEPIRLPAIVVAILIVVAAAGVAALLDLDINQVIAIIVGTVPVAAGLMGYAESRRARTMSPATVKESVQGLADANLYNEDVVSAHAFDEADGEH